MQDRRSFLASAVFSVAGLSATGLSAAGLPFADAAPRLQVQRIGKFFLVEGWVLTAEDVRALGVNAV